MPRNASTLLQTAKTITYLAPNVNPMPGRMLLSGQLKWIDEQ